MKYTTEVTINLPRNRVIELFDSTKNLQQWQVGLKSFETISGNPGQEGTRSKMVYEGRKGDLEMTETITKRNLPDEYHGIYKARGVYNEIYNYFTEPEERRTHWRIVSVFRFRGLMALMAPFMKTAFTHNTLLNMERFKSFAEKTNQQ
ncbi:MAG: SRPBCC family protein [Bacteroidota bacterium]